MVELSGQQLTLQQIVDVANGKEQVALSAEARVRVEDARRVVEQIVAENRTVYGVNTGFGKLSDVSIEQADLRQLQLNLVRSHSVGLGEPLSEPEARQPQMLTRAAVQVRAGVRVTRDCVYAVHFRGRMAERERSARIRFFQ